MKERSCRLFIEDILESMNMIEEYIRGMEQENFSTDRKTIDAVIRNIEIIGEAAKNVPECVRRKYSTIPWKNMIGLRNISIHAYFGVDLDIIWRIVTVNIPAAKFEIIKMLESFHDVS